MKKIFSYNRLITLGLLLVLFVPLMANDSNTDEKTKTAVFAVG